MALKINRNLQRITKIIGWVLLIVVICAMVKVLTWENDYYSHKTTEERAEAIPVLTSISEAGSISTDEVTEEEFNEYQTLGKTPKTLEIPRLNVRALIQSSDANADGTLPVPTNINKAMWFSPSAMPDGGGVIILSGINSVLGKNGIFKNLDSLENGDEINIVTGDDSKATYVVADVKIVNPDQIKDELPGMQRKIEDKETLSLISVKNTTSDKNQYESIVMIRATRK